jgi:hypothetical protein
MLTYSTLSRSNLISHNRVVLRTEDQHKPKVLGAPTADPTWQAMKPCDAQKDLTSYAGVCAGRGMGRKPAIPPSVPSYLFRVAEGGNVGFILIGRLRKGVEVMDGVRKVG